MTRARTLADLGSQSLATDAELASEVSTINSAIAAKPTYAFSASAPSSPSNGDLWMDTSGASPKGKVWNGSEWKLFSGASAATFDEGASTGATFSTLTNPDGDGKNYRLAAFTSVGGSHSLSISTSGMAEVLVVAGGGGGGGGQNAGKGGGGAGGYLHFQQIFLSSGAKAVVVGDGGNGGGDANSPSGGVKGASSVFAGIQAIGGGGGGYSPSYNTGIVTAGATGGSGGGGNPGAAAELGGTQGNAGASLAGGGAGSAASGNTEGSGITNTISGSSVEYSRGGASTNAATTTYGSGGKAGGAYAAGSKGQQGVVYVRVEL